MTRYEVDVIGETWSGARGTYTYTIEAESVKDLRGRLKYQAGDFNVVLDWQAWEPVRCSQCGVVHRELVRDFADSELEAEFMGILGMAG